MRKRLISMVLAVSMAVSIMPAPAFASGGGQQSETVIGQEIDRQNSSEGYSEVSSLDQLTYTSKECKVRLTEDIEMTVAVTVDNGKSLTIDLNGHTLTAPENSKAFWIRNGCHSGQWDRKRLRRCHLDEQRRQQQCTEADRRHDPRL